MDAEPIRQAVRLLRRARCAVALTGAGISTPSGIPDFRSAESGLWEHVDPMQVASIYAFRADPLSFYRWVKPLARALRTARPNPAHLALAQLEALGLLSALITQNIDMLHARAGSQHVLEVHGHLREATCIDCFKVMPAAALLDAWLDQSELPRCPDCGHAMKPNVVLYGEQLPMNVFIEAKMAARRCDVMIVAGSSLEVFPVAELPSLAVSGGAKLIIVNREPTYMDERAAVIIRDDVAIALPAIAEEASHAAA